MLSPDPLSVSLVLIGQLNDRVCELEAAVRVTSVMVRPGIVPVLKLPPQTIVPSVVETDPVERIVSKKVNIEKPSIPEANQTRSKEFNYRPPGGSDHPMNPWTLYFERSFDERRYLMETSEFTHKSKLRSHSVLTVLYAVLAIVIICNDSSEWYISVVDIVAVAVSLIAHSKKRWSQIYGTAVCCLSTSVSIIVGAFGDYSEASFGVVMSYVLGFLLVYISKMRFRIALHLLLGSVCGLGIAIGAQGGLNNGNGRLQIGRTILFSVIWLVLVYTQECTLRSRFKLRSALNKSLVQKQVLESQLEISKKDTLQSEVKVQYLLHCVKNPLNAINGFLHELELTPLDSDQEGLLMHAMGASYNLYRVLNNQGLLGALDYKHLTYTPGEMTPMDIVQMARKRAHRGMSSKTGVKFEVKMDTRLKDATVTSDGYIVNHILRTLIENAFRFTEAGRVCLRVELNGAGDQIKFSVKDTGVGISDRETVDVFSRYENNVAAIISSGVSDPAVSVRNTLFNFSGLGLNICSRMAALLPSGRLRVVSEDGKGSTFSLEYARTPPSPEQPPRVGVSSGPGGGGSGPGSTAGNYGADDGGAATQRGGGGSLKLDYLDTVRGAEPVSGEQDPMKTNRISNGDVMKTIVIKKGRGRAGGGGEGGGGGGTKATTGNDLFSPRTSIFGERADGPVHSSLEVANALSAGEEEYEEYEDSGIIFFTPQTAKTQSRRSSALVGGKGLETQKKPGGGSSPRGIFSPRDKVEQQQKQNPKQVDSIFSPRDKAGQEHKQESKQDVSIFSPRDKAGQEHKQESKQDVSLFSPRDKAGQEHKQDPKQDVSLFSPRDKAGQEHKQDPKQDVSIFSPRDKVGQEHKQESKQDVSIFSPRDKEGQQQMQDPKQDVSIFSPRDKVKLEQKPGEVEDITNGSKVMLFSPRDNPAGVPAAAPKDATPLALFSPRDTPQPTVQQQQRHGSEQQLEVEGLFTSNLDEELSPLEALSTDTFEVRREAMVAAVAPIDSKGVLGETFVVKEKRKPGMGDGEEVPSTEAVIELDRSRGVNSSSGLNGSIPRPGSIASPREELSWSHGTGSGGKRSERRPSADVEEMSKRTILLVDDNSMNLKLYSRWMKKSHFDFVTAVNGQQAVNAVVRNRARFDAIIMDIHMPVMNGDDASAKIREYEHQKGAPRQLIIAVSANTSASDRQRYERSGVDAVLPKPFSHKLLVNTIVKYGKFLSPAEVTELQKTLR